MGNDAATQESPRVAATLLSGLLLVCSFLVAAAAQLFASEAWLTSPLGVRALAGLGVAFALAATLLAVLGMNRLYNLVRGLERQQDAAAHRRAIAGAASRAAWCVFFSLLCLGTAFTLRVWGAAVPSEAARTLPPAAVPELALRVEQSVCVLIEAESASHRTTLVVRPCPAPPPPE